MFINLVVIFLVVYGLGSGSQLIAQKVNDSVSSFGKKAESPPTPRPTPTPTPRPTATMAQVQQPIRRFV